jgi:hypothetical protein
MKGLGGWKGIWVLVDGISGFLKIKYPMSLLELMGL